MAWDTTGFKLWFIMKIDHNYSIESIQGVHSSSKKYRKNFVQLLKDAKEKGQNAYIDL